MKDKTVEEKARDLIDNLPCWQYGDNNEGVIIETGEDILITRIASALKEAMAQEREACAKVADDPMRVFAHKAFEADPYASRANLVAPLIAKAIRQRTT